MIGGLRFDGAIAVLHYWLKRQVTTALLVDKVVWRIHVGLIGVSRREFSAHFVLTWRILIGRGILKASRILEGTLGDVPLEE